MDNVTKLSYGETVVAIIKGYCAIVILFVPSAFVNGGWAMSSFLMVGSAAVTTICVLKMVECGMKLGIYSYGGIVETTLGKKAKMLADIMIACTQYSFTISHFTFETESMKSSVDTIYGVDSPKLWYAIIVLSMCIPLAWIRDLGKLSWTFMIGTFVICVTVIVVVCYCTTSLVNNGTAEGVVAFNKSSFLITLGFVFYAYEGIGVVMPIMQACG